MSRRYNFSDIRGIGYISKRSNLNRSGDRIITIPLYCLNQKVFETLKQDIGTFSSSRGNTDNTRLYNSGFICNWLNLLLVCASNLTLNLLEDYCKKSLKKDSKLKATSLSNTKFGYKGSNQNSHTVKNLSAIGRRSCSTKSTLSSLKDLEKIY
jgi:hypothetical protein